LVALQSLSGRTLASEEEKMVERMRYGHLQALEILLLLRLLLLLPVPGFDI